MSAEDKKKLDEIENSFGGVSDLSVFDTFKNLLSSDTGTTLTIDSTAKSIKLSGGGLYSGSEKATITPLVFTDWVSSGFRYLKFELVNQGGGSGIYLKTADTNQIVSQTVLTGNNEEEIVIIDLTNFSSTYSLEISHSWSSKSGGNTIFKTPVVSISKV